MPRILIIFVSLLLLSSCGSESDTFRLEGRLRKIHQAQLFVYSPDGGITGRDTIKVLDGRFAYETRMGDKHTLILVFPNHSEHPVFAEPGAEVTISGHASQLREMEIEGTDDNELYTEFRQETLDMKPAEMDKAIEEFLKEHPASQVCRYLIDKYYIRTASPDYKRALELVGVVLAEVPDSPRLLLLQKQISRLAAFASHETLPPFTARTVLGDTITRDSLNAKVNVVSLWASWHNGSMAIQRLLKAMKEDYGDSLKVVSICLEADTVVAMRAAKGDRKALIGVCDGMMWDSPLMDSLALTTADANIITDRKGRIMATNLERKALESKIESLMK